MLIQSVFVSRLLINCLIWIEDLSHEMNGTIDPPFTAPWPLEIVSSTLPISCGSTYASYTIQFFAITHVYGLDAKKYSFTIATTCMEIRCVLLCILCSVGDMEIWTNSSIAKAHKHREDPTPLSKDRVYRRAKGFPWLSHNLYEVQKHGTQKLLVPLP